MTNLKNKLNPLTWNVAIVDRLGMPTAEFQRKWAQQIQTNKSIIDLTKAAGVSDVLDLIGATKGDLLYRTAADWETLAPGATNTILSIVAGVPAWVVPTANPTGTGSDVATNGTATTFMRSDATFAIQKTSSSVFGLCKVDGSTITAVGGVISAAGSVSPANPTATAGPTAVNGSAATFMRSDAAPAVQKGSSSQFGIVEVDGTTITAAAGVISAVQPAGANPTATAGPAAVNGVATTFMRSDGAPAIQLTTSGQKGICQVDGTTVTASSGVISAAIRTAANPTGTASDTAVNGSAATYMRSDAAPAVQKTSSSAFGLCKPDNVTVTASSGVLTATALPAGSGAGCPGFVSGQYYFSTGIVTDPAQSSASTVTTLYALPFYVPQATTFSVIGIHVTGGQSGASLQLGIYGTTAGLPGTLLYDAGNVAATSSGDKELTGLSMTISSPGWYWLAMGVNTPGVAPSLTNAQGANASMLSIIGGTASNAASAVYSVKASWTPGSLPLSFPGSPSYGTAAWGVYVRV